MHGLRARFDYLIFLSLRFLSGLLLVAWSMHFSKTTERIVGHMERLDFHFCWKVVIQKKDPRRNKIEGALGRPWTTQRFPEVRNGVKRELSVPPEIMNVEVLKCLVK